MPTNEATHHCIGNPCWICYPAAKPRAYDYQSYDNEELNFMNARIRALEAAWKAETLMREKFQLEATEWKNKAVAFELAMENGLHENHLLKQEIEALERR